MSLNKTSSLSVEQARLLLRAARGHPFEALLITALVTGIRRGELLALRWHDLDFETGWISLSRELSVLDIEELALKQLERRRDIPLSPQLVERLQQHRRAQQEMRVQQGSTWSEQDLVFCDERGGFLPRFDLFQALHELLVKARLKEVPFHNLRASTAYMLLLAGVHSLVVEKLLGHSAMITDPEPIAPVLLQDAVNTLSRRLFSADEGEEVTSWRKKGGDSRDCAQFNR